MMRCGDDMSKKLIYRAIIGQDYESQCEKWEIKWNSWKCSFDELTEKNKLLLNGDETAMYTQQVDYNFLITKFNY